MHTPVISLSYWHDLHSRDALCFSPGERRNDRAGHVAFMIPGVHESSLGAMEIGRARCFALRTRIDHYRLRFNAIFRLGQSFGGHGTVIAVQLQCHHKKRKSNHFIQ